MSKNNNGFQYLASGIYTPEKHAKFIKWLEEFQIRAENSDDDMEQEFEDHIFLAEQCFMRTEKLWTEAQPGVLRLDRNKKETP